MAKWSRTVLIYIVPTYMSFMLLAGASIALDQERQFDIPPGGYDDLAIPYRKANVEIRVTSDIPVDVYIMDNDQLIRFEDKKVPTEREAYYADVTYSSVEYDGEGDTLFHWVLMINDDPTRTANVTVGYTYPEDDKDEIDDGTCLSTIIAGISTIVGAVAVFHLIRKR